MITSPDNEKLKLIRKLRLKKHRVKHGLFVTEGEDLLEAGLAAGVRPRAVLVHPDAGIAGEAVEPELLDGVSELGSGTRVIGIWPRAWADGTGDMVVWLDRIGDPGNVGTIIRTVNGLLAATVVLSPGCADPFSGAAVRAGMGSIFAQPLRMGDITDTPEPRTALVAHGGGVPGPRTSPLTLVIGAEREGVSDAALKLCQEKWTIKLRSGGSESLNVAAAAAIACERLSSSPEAPNPEPGADE